MKVCPINLGHNAMEPWRTWLWCVNVHVKLLIMTGFWGCFSRMHEIMAVLLN